MYSSSSSVTIAVDLGFCNSGTALSIFSDTTNELLLSEMVITKHEFSSVEYASDKLYTFFDSLNLDALQVSRLIVEKVPFVKNFDTATKLIEITTAVLLVAHKYKIKVIKINNAIIKKYIRKANTELGLYNSDKAKVLLEEFAKNVVKTELDISNFTQDQYDTISLYYGYLKIENDKIEKELKKQTKF